MTVVCAAALGLLACSSAVSGEGTGGTKSTSATTSTGAAGGESATGTGGSATGTGGSATGTGGSAAGDTWGNYAEGFFEKFCVECHSPTVNPMYDFTQYAIVKKNAPTIRCGVAATHQSGCASTPMPTQFPISDAAGTNPKPSDAERARIVAWIEAGTPE